MSMSKKFTAGLLIVALLVLGSLAVGSFWTFMEAFTAGDMSGAMVQFVTFAIITFIIGILVTSTWYKRKIH